MRNKRAAMLVVSLSVLAVVLVVVGIVALGPALMNAIRSMHSIPPH